VRRGGKPPELEDPREDFHLAGAIYIQSGRCDFISQMMLQAKVYCVPLGTSNCLKPTLQFQQRRDREPKPYPQDYPVGHARESGL